MKKITQEQLLNTVKEVYVFWKQNPHLIVFLLYALFLLITEMFLSYIFKINRSFFNAFFQAAPLILAVCGIGFLITGKAGKIFLSVTAVISTFFTLSACFLASVFKLRLNGDMYAVLAASSVEESREFIQVFINWKVFVLLLIACSVLTGLLYFLWKNPFKRCRILTLTGIVLLLPYMINTVRFCAEKDLAELYERNTESRMIAGFFVFQNNLKGVLDMIHHPKLPKKIRSTYQGKITGILVIGESATRNHMGIYGYGRPTTPRMELLKKDLLIFDDVVSPYCVTVDACRAMLTTAEPPELTPLDYTVFNVFREAGFKIKSISNQFRWGKRDGPVNLLFSAAHERTFIQEEQRRAFDEAVLPLLRKYLTDTEQSQLLVVHLMGSHSKFSDRYPKDFNFFNGRKDACNALFSSRTAEKINSYDNSIAYTDHVLGEIISLVEKSPLPGFVLYVSDHGEVPGFRGGRSAASKAPGYFEVPFVFFGNTLYRRSSPEFMAQASANIHTPWQTDSLLYSLLSAAGVTFENFPYEKDIFSAACKGRSHRKIGTSHATYIKKQVKPPFTMDQKGEIQPLK